MVTRRQQTSGIGNRKQSISHAKHNRKKLLDGKKETTNFQNKEQTTTTSIIHMEKGQILNLGTEEQELPVPLTNSS
jgi:hypothetical protein